MAIVTDFGCSVQEYVEGFGKLSFPRPAKCPHCRKAHTLIGHGYYRRKALDQGSVYLVKIKRWCCKACHRTVSVLPSFLLRFRHYILAVIQQVIVTRYEGRASWAQLLERCAAQGVPSERSIKRWCRSFAEQAPRWLAAVQQTLAQHDQVSPWLDPLGEAVEPQGTPSALLQATLHLLAWAKTSWAEVMRYGLIDRLRFLWHWGTAQGLGRLV